MVAHLFLIRRAAALAALLACATGHTQSPRQPGDIEVRLGLAEQTRLGVSTVRLEPVEAPDTIDGIGRVLDVTPLAQLDAEIETATAIAEASAREAERLAVLAADDQNASRQALEAARAQSAADAVRLHLAIQRVSLEWGAGMASLDVQGRRQLIAQIAAGQAALLRIDPLGAQNLAKVTVLLRPDPGLPAIATEVLGPAAAADAQMQTRGLLVTVRGGDTVELPTGRVLAAEIESGQRSGGILLPRGALVRINDSTWVYLRVGEEVFIRRAVIGPRIQDSGWFVSEGFAPGDEVIDAGAGSLLAAERSDDVVVED